MVAPDIKFASTPDGLTHEFNCLVPKSLKEKFEGLYEDQKGTTDLMVIDSKIKELNASSGNLITDYEYEMVSDSDVNIGVTFKHLFKSLKEPARYMKCKVRAQDGKILVKVTDKIQTKLNISKSHQRVPISSLIAECIDCENSDECKLSIRFVTTSSKTDIANFDTVITFITEGLYEAFEEANSV